MEVVSDIVVDVEVEDEVLVLREVLVEEVEIEILVEEEVDTEVEVLDVLVDIEVELIDVEDVETV